MVNKAVGGLWEPIALPRQALPLGGQSQNSVSASLGAAESFAPAEAFLLVLGPANSLRVGVAGPEEGRRSGPGAKSFC